MAMAVDQGVRLPKAAPEEGLGRDSNNQQFCRLTENRLGKSGFRKIPLISLIPKTHPVFRFRR